MLSRVEQLPASCQSFVGSNIPVSTAEGGKHHACCLQRRHLLCDTSVLLMHTWYIGCSHPLYKLCVCFTGLQASRHTCSVPCMQHGCALPIVASTSGKPGCRVAGLPGVTHQQLADGWQREGLAARLANMLTAARVTLPDPHSTSRLPVGLWQASRHWSDCHYCYTPGPAPWLCCSLASAFLTGHTK